MATKYEEALDELTRMSTALHKIWGQSGRMLTLPTAGDRILLVRHEDVEGLFDISRLEWAVRSPDLRSDMTRRAQAVKRDAQAKERTDD